jgi:hypothetical protein
VHPWKEAYNTPNNMMLQEVRHGRTAALLFAAHGQGLCPRLSGTVTPWPTKLTLKPSGYFRCQMYCPLLMGLTSANRGSAALRSRVWLPYQNSLGHGLSGVRSRR